MENQKKAIFPKSIRKIVERGKIDTHNTQIYERRYWYDCLYNLIQRNKSVICNIVKTDYDMHTYKQIIKFVKTRKHYTTK
jgi:hypothetical protein